MSIATMTSAPSAPLPSNRLAGAFKRTRVDRAGRRLAAALDAYRSHLLASDAGAVDPDDLTLAGADLSCFSRSAASASARPATSRIRPRPMAGRGETGPLTGVV